jgi:hypothetical protein
LLRVSGASSVQYRSGSATSTLTAVLTSSGTYTQPLGSDGLLDSKAFGDDSCELPTVVVGRRNRSGIFMVFEGVDEVTCQRCGLRTIEANPCHAVGLKGALQWESRGEIERGVRDDRGMSVAVLVLFSTPSTLSEIVRGG